jgi:hypothetical protein
LVDELHLVLAPAPDGSPNPAIVEAGEVSLSLHAKRRELQQKKAAMKRLSLGGNASQQNKGVVAEINL